MTHTTPASQLQHHLWPQGTGQQQQLGLQSVYLTKEVPMTLLSYPHRSSGTHEPDNTRYGKDTHDPDSPSIISLPLQLWSCDTGDPRCRTLAILVPKAAKLATTAVTLAKSHQQP